MNSRYRSADRRACSLPQPANETGSELTVIANLELMPMRANASKNAKIGSRQVQKAEELYRAGLLSTDGLAKVRASGHQ